MKRTEEIIRLKVQKKIVRIVAALKKDAAKQIRDEMMADLVKTEHEATFAFDFDHGFINDIVDIITEEIGNHLHRQKW